MKFVLGILIVGFILTKIEEWIDKYINTPRDGYTPETGAKQTKTVRFGYKRTYKEPFEWFI